MHRSLITLLFAATIGAISLGTAPPSLGVEGQANTLPGIIGKDDRVPLDSTQWPWQAIGRVNQPDARGHCTGTLVAKDRVLTAVHCLFDQKAKRWFEPSELVFVANPRRDEDAGFARAQRIIKSQNREPSSDLESLKVDWAILELEHPLKVKPIPIVPISARNQDEMKGLLVSTAGYPKDRPYLLDVDFHCGIQAIIGDDRVFVTDCDSTSGDSGAPLLLQHGSEYVVIGVFSAATLANAVDPRSFAVNASAFHSP